MLVLWLLASDGLCLHSAAMGKKRNKNTMPKLIDAGAAASSSALRINPKSGAVTLAPHALTATALPSAKPTSLAPAAPAAPKLSRGEKKKAAAQTTGAAWGHMGAPTMTPELKRELLIVKMRGVLDPKRFYRTSDSNKELPKYFQMGTVVEGAEDGRNHKLSKKQRKTSLVDELLADVAVKKRAKAQYQKSQEANASGRKRLIRSKGGIGKKKTKRAF